MKVKDRYWEVENSIRFANPEKATRPLLCEPKVFEDGVRIRLWLRNLAEGTGAGGAIVLLSRDEAAVLANAIDTRSNWIGEKNQRHAAHRRERHRDLHDNPVHGMRGSGTHRTPSGGWRAFGVVSARHGRRLLACPLRIRAGGGEMSDKMMRRTLIVCAGVLVLCGLPMVVMAVVQRDVRMGLYGVMSLLFALSDVLRLFLTADIPPAAPPRPELSITADPVVYRDPVSGERFAVVTISNTVCLWDSSAQDALTTAYSEILWLGNGQGERTSTTANALNQQEACGHDREDR